MEVTVNKQQFRKLATVSAAAALSLQLLAGVASAAVPTADASGSSYGAYGGNGNAGFQTTFVYGDGSTLSKLYLEADISNATDVVILEATKNGDAVNGCSENASPFGIKCLFKTVRYGDTFVVTFAVVGNGGTVSTLPLWSSTGYVTGGNQSHGDAWIGSDNDLALTAAYNGDANFAGGFGNTSLNTSTTNLGGNGQAASLKNLPNGKYAFVNDNAGDAPDSDYPFIELSVNDGAPATFQVLIVYPKGTSAPKYFEHVSAGYATVNYYACAKNAPKLNCFDWSNKNNTVTMYPAHNGTLRRSG